MQLQSNSNCSPPRHGQGAFEYRHSWNPYEPAVHTTQGSVIATRQLAPKHHSKLQVHDAQIGYTLI